MTRYAIAGGEEGKARLKLLSEVMLPFTSRLLNDLGICEGLKCLDVGCGGGFVTALLSDMVGPTGEVVGVDADESILDLAREDAANEERNNVQFIKADASLPHLEDFYDVVYARFLLTHVPEPERCLQSMIDNCKAGGLVVVEDIDFTGSFCYPPSNIFKRYTELYQKVVIKRRGDPNIGPRLPVMLRNAGLRDVRVNIAQPVHLEGNGKLMASITMQRIADAVVSEQIASKAEVAEVVEGLNEIAVDPDSLISLPRIFQVYGRK